MLLAKYAYGEKAHTLDTISGSWVESYSLSVYSVCEKSILACSKKYFSRWCSAKIVFPPSPYTSSHYMFTYQWVHVVVLLPRFDTVMIKMAINMKQSFVYEGLRCHQFCLIWNLHTECFQKFSVSAFMSYFNPLNIELNPICWPS